MQKLLDATDGPGMLFDKDRSTPADQAISVASIEANVSLWIVGDLHGDVLALEAAVTLARREGAVEGKTPHFVFLGDLFDDGGYPVEVLIRLFELICEQPASVCVIAGNHDEALRYDDGRFFSLVEPCDFADLLNSSTDAILRETGMLAIRLFANAPRALFFPDGLLIAHGGFPLADVHSKLLETGDWNTPECLSDFVWVRAHPTARKKLPNRHSRGSQFGYEDFAAFCALTKIMGRPVTHLARGHDHVDERYAVYAHDSRHPIITTVALSRRLEREMLGDYARVPTLCRYVEGALPQVFRLMAPPALIREFYPEMDHVENGKECSREDGP